MKILSQQTPAILSLLAAAALSSCAHTASSGARGPAAVKSYVALQGRASELASRVRNLKAPSAATEKRIEEYVELLLSPEIREKAGFTRVDQLIRELHSRLLMALESSRLSATAREELLAPVKNAYWRFSRSTEKNVLQQIAMLEEHLGAFPGRAAPVKLSQIRYELERLVFAVDEPKELSERLLKLLAEDQSAAASPAATPSALDARKRARQLLGSVSGQTQA